MALSSCFAAIRSSRRAERAFGLQVSSMLLHHHGKSHCKQSGALGFCCCFLGSAARVSVKESATSPATCIFSACVAVEGTTLLRRCRAVMNALSFVLTSPIQTLGILSLLHVIPCALHSKEHPFEPSARHRRGGRHFLLSAKPGPGLNEQWPGTLDERLAQPLSGCRCISSCSGR